MTADTARAILTARDTLGRPTADLGNVVTAAHASPADLGDLVHTGKMRCDALGREVAVGVLLPLRIETRFRAPGPERPSLFQGSIGPLRPRSVCGPGKAAPLLKLVRFRRK